MKIMFPRAGLIAILTMLLVAPSLLGAINNGDRVQLSWPSSTYGHIQGGGEFLVTKVGGSPSDQFKTFCLEYSEHISLSTSYFATIDDKAKLGGGGPNPDPLSAESQFLYAAYRSGALSSFAAESGIGPFVYNNDTWASALQLAFWKLEEEVPSAVSSSLANKRDYLIGLYDSSVTYFKNGSLYYFVGDVKVMNLWTSYTSSSGGSGPKQSQLYLDPTTTPPAPPVPEPATLVIWGLGLGILGLVKFHRGPQINRALN